MTQHTPEFFPEFEHHPNYGKRLAYGNDAVILNRNQYARARACVNACAGIDEPEEVIQGMRFEIESLKRWRDGEHNAIDYWMATGLKASQQHDELLDTLATISNYCTMEMHPDDNDKQYTRLCLIKEAITKAGIE